MYMRPSHLVLEAGAESRARLVRLLLLGLLFLLQLEEVDLAIESQALRLLVRPHVHIQGLRELRIGLPRERLQLLRRQGLLISVEPLG